MLRTYFPKLSLQQQIGDPNIAGYVIYDHFYHDEMVDAGYSKHRVTKELTLVFLDSTGRIITTISGNGSEVHDLTYSRETTQKLLGAAVIKAYDTALVQMDQQLKERLAKN